MTNNNKHEPTGLELARFLVNESYIFFGNLKQKLDNFDSTRDLPVSTPATVRKRKPADPNREKRKRSAFNLFIGEEIAKSKASGSLAPEGEKKGGWLLKEAALKWRNMSQAEKDAYAQQVQGALDKLNADASAEFAAAHLAPDVLAEATSPTSPPKRKKKARVDPELDNFAATLETPTAELAGEGELQKKKKKKKKKHLTEENAEN